MTPETWQWISLLGILVVHTAALFRWGGRVGVQLEQHERLHEEHHKAVNLLRETDASQGQVLAVSTRLLEVHAEEIQRLRDWRHDDYAQWAQRIEARIANLELDRRTHGT